MPVRRRAHHGGYPWSMSQLQGKDGVAIPVYDMGKPGRHAEPSRPSPLSRLRRVLGCEVKRQGDCSSWAGTTT